MTRNSSPVWPLRPNLRSASRLFAAWLTALILAGCATDPGTGYPWPYPDQPERPAPRQPAPEPGVPDPLPGVPSPWPEPEPSAPPSSDTPRDARQAGGPAVLALLDQSDAAMAVGELSRSAAAVERALRIEPRNPFLWQELADIRLEQGQAGQAEVLARKSIGLAQGNPYAEYGGWLRVMYAREMLGDLEGAKAARDEVQRLRRYSD